MLVDVLVHIGCSIGIAPPLVYILENKNTHIETCHQHQVHIFTRQQFKVALQPSPHSANHLHNVQAT
jgi:hypothetical protein